MLRVLPASPILIISASLPACSAGLGPGRIQQAFVFSLKEDMTEYYRLIAVLGAQLNLDSGGGASAGGTEGLTLQRLFVWVMDPLKRLKVLATLVAAAAQLKVGRRNGTRPRTCFAAIIPSPLPLAMYVAVF